MKNFKTKMLQLLSPKNANNTAKRIVVVLLAAVMLLSMLPLQGIGVKGLGEIVTNYPLLNELDRKGPTNENWQYGFLDYSVKAALSASAADYTAPVATWSSANLTATVNWNTVPGATKYKLLIFKDTQSVVDTVITNTTWNSGYRGLEGGVEYQIQVIALDDADTPVKASKVCVFNTDESIANSSYAFGGAAVPFYGNKYSRSTYYNSAFGNSMLYTFTTAAKNGRFIKVNATASSAAKYGAYLTFTAPENGTYDFSAGFTVLKSDKAIGYVKSRIIKIDEHGAETIVWPYTSGQEWNSLELTTADPKPVSKIGAPQVSLKKDERIVVQIYYDCDVSTGAKSVEVALANPTVTKVAEDVSYKTGIRSYNFGAYAPQYIFGEDNITANWIQYNARWSSEIIEVDAGTVAKTVPYTAWNPKKDIESLTTQFTVNRVKYDIGYNYYTRTTPVVGTEGALMLGASNRGVAFNFESPAEGIALVSTVVSGNNDHAFSYRLVKNGVQVYPTGVGGQAVWKTISVAGENQISISCDTKKGDVLSLQFYSEEGAAYSFDVNKMPSVTIYEDSVANKPTDSVFSPLWERPFQGKSEPEYDFVAIAGNAWQFGIINNPNAVGEYLSDANKYNTAEKYLFAKGDSSKVSGYIFDDNELKFKLGSTKHGMSLTFQAPVSAYYDFSTALNKLTDIKGDVYFRFLKNENKLWPKDGEWAVFEDGKGDLPAQETLLAAGESLTLQVYGDIKESDPEADPPEDNSIIIGLGTLAVQKLNHKSETGVKTILSYEPVSYKVFEKGYDAAYIPLNGRFNYSFMKGEEVIALNKSTSATGILSADDKNFVTLTDKPLSFTAEGGNTLVVDYVAGTTAVADINLSAESITAGTQMQIEQGDTIIVPWTETIPGIVNTNVVKGEKVTFKFKNEADFSAIFNAFVIMVEAESASDDITENTTYYAIKSNISTESLYTGKYKTPESSYWQYDVYRTADDAIVGSNYYVGDLIPRVYNTDLNNIGYYFEGSNLSAEIEKSAAATNGIALGFKAPKDNVYSFKTGMTLTTAGAKATVKARVVVFKADGNEKVWPTDAEWFEKELNEGESLNVPFITLELAAGDKAYFMAYASESTADRLKFNMASPAFSVATATSVYEDIRQDLITYNAVDGRPYTAVSGFDGTYIPQTDRWNFRFTQGDKVYDADYYKKESSLASLRNNSLIGKPSHTFNITNKNIVVKYSLTPDAATDVGSEISFYAPTKGDYMLNAPILPTNFNKVTGAAVKLQVIKRAASDGKETKVWPRDKDTEWEVMDNYDLPSNCRKLFVEAEMGDEFIIRSRVDVSDEARTAYFTANPSKAFVEISASATFTAIEAIIDETVESYTSANAIPNQNTLDALWTVQYALHADNPDWRTCYCGAIVNYITSDGAYDIAGISILNGGKVIIQNKRDNFAKANTERVSVCYMFRSPRDGYVRMSGSAGAGATLSEALEGVEGMFRLTLNGKVIWPEDGAWHRINRDQGAKLGSIEIETKKGDELRFEYTTDKYPPADKPLYMSGVPSFLFTKTANYYNITGDIYSYLGDDMTTYFKGVTPAIFNENDAAGKLMSEQVAARKAAAAAAGPYVPPEENATAGGEQQVTTTITTITTPGDYTEWTEEIYTPGEKIKHTYTKVIGTNWLPIIIAIVSAVVALIGIGLVLIILQKKGKITFLAKFIK